MAMVEFVGDVPGVALRDRRRRNFFEEEEGEETYVPGVCDGFHFWVCVGVFSFLKNMKKMMGWWQWRFGDCEWGCRWGKAKWWWWKLGFMCSAFSGPIRRT